jgi:zinc finger protein
MCFCPLCARETAAHAVAQGMTNLLLTSIPFFKEVIIASFLCEHCGNRNNEIQSAGQIQPRGAVYTVKASIKRDLNRQMVRSEYCTISIPDFELTIPPSNQKGQMTNIEGIIQDAVRDLAIGQPVRQHTDAETYDKIETLLGKLRAIAPAEDQGSDEEEAIPPFTIRLDDPSGNSFLEPSAELGLRDPKWSKREYERSREQDVLIGLAEAEPEEAAAKTLTDDMDKPEEVYSFPDVCNSCGATLETFMKKVEIPHFKEVMLMSTNCHSCGYRDNEIKSGGAIAAQAKKIVLKVEDEEDLKRDILKVRRPLSAALSSPFAERHIRLQNPRNRAGAQSRHPRRALHHARRVAQPGVRGA